MSSQDRAWADEAIRRINAENNRSADTHLYSVPLPEHWGVQLYLKDESTHRSGSLKHRLARSLFLFGLVNGWIREGTTIVEASSGSTAVSEAYFAQLLGPAVHRRHDPHHQSGEDRPDRAVRRLLPPGGPRLGGLRGRGGSGPDNPRALHGPVHLRRAGHRLAGKQQHRRVHLRAAGPRRAPDPPLDRRGRGHRRHQRHHRQVPALPPPRHGARRRGPGELRLLPRLAGRRRRLQHGDAVPHRGNRAAADGAELRARRDRPHDPGARCRVGGRDAAPARPRRTARRPVHRDQPLGRVAADRRNGRGRNAGQRGLADVRRAATATPGSYYNDEWLQARGLDPRPHEATIRDFFETGSWPGGTRPPPNRRWRGARIRCRTWPPAASHALR